MQVIFEVVRESRALQHPENPIGHGARSGRPRRPTDVPTTNAVTSARAGLALRSVKRWLGRMEAYAATPAGVAPPPKIAKISCEQALWQTLCRVWFQDFL